MARICLIDLSGVFRQHWHASEQDGISAAFNKTLQAVTGFAAGFEAVGICVDTPPYKRSEIAPDYKAHREKAPQVLHEQLAKVVEQLDRDGYHILGAKGYEADDIIATVCKWATDEVVVYSADKDMLQLVRDNSVLGPQIKVISSATGVVYDRDAVLAKFGVGPTLIPDMLALMGDKSDGIPGIAGVGPKTAAIWLNLYGSLGNVLANADKLEPARFREIVAAGKDIVSQSLTLARLMNDAPINPEIIMEPKEPQKEEPKPEPPVTVIDEPAPMAVATTQPQPMVTVEYERALEPRDSTGAVRLAQYLYQSRMFGSFPTMEAILATILAGRQYGLGAIQSLHGFHNIKGKQSASAMLIVGLCKRHEVCKYFRLVESTPERATYETLRKGEPEPTRMTYTIEMAKVAGLTGKDNWRNDPGAMCLARAGARLARAVYPDITAGLYCPDEIEDS